MQNEPSEFAAPCAPNKDMWLFLIVLDVIILCVMGFLLYNHFSARLLHPVSVTEQTVQIPEVLEEVFVAQADVVAAAPQEPALQPEEKPMLPAQDDVPSAPVISEAAPALQPEQQPAQTPVAAAQEVRPAEPKQSILVTPVNGSKYRRVTFRWFDPAEKVSIVSGFTSRKPQALKKVGDYWETTLSIAPGTYKFLYIVDGKNTVDPYAAQKDGRSVVIVE